MKKLFVRDNKVAKQLFSFLKKYRSSHRSCRSTRRMCFVKKVVLKNFANFTGKHPFELFLNKVSGLQLASFFKRDPIQVLSCEVCETFKNTYLGSSTQYVHKNGEGRGQAKCIRLRTRGEGGFKVAYICKKNFFFWTTKSQKFSFFVLKKLLHCHLLLLCIEKCKPFLSYKQKPQKSFSIAIYIAVVWFTSFFCVFHEVNF